MKATSDVTLSIISEAEPFSHARSTVLIEGKNTGIAVSGKILEAAIKIAEYRYLLFLTDDVIFEESLMITLLDSTAGILESVELGVQYVTGSFKDLQIEQESANFRFIGDIVWTVKVLKSSSFRLPFSDPTGVSRRLGLSKYIDISATPCP